MAIPESASVFMRGVVERARKLNKKIVFPEGGDPRVVEAAARLARDGVVRPVLIGPVPAAAPAGVSFIEPTATPLASKYAALYYERRRAKGVTQVEAAEIARRPLYFAALMVGAGDADGFVGGAVNTTADTVRAALHCIGAAPRAKLVSSVFLMALQDMSMGHNGLMAFADCAVVIEPCAVELADIAIATAESARVLMNAEPAVALLSFSTKGSGKHEQVNRRIAGGRGGGGSRGTLKGGGVACGGARQHADFPEPGGGEYRLQAGGAVGGRGGYRTVFARAGETG
jgi:phosphate acetyltransferase